MDGIGSNGHKRNGFKKLERSIDDIIAGLTFDLESTTSLSDLDLESLIQSWEDEVMELSEEDLQKISELKAITDTMGDRLLGKSSTNLPDTFKINYAAELNDNQLKAVVHTENPLLVIAGAGSGKTRVITYKVAYLIEKGMIPSQILLLTFTRKAADEMTERVQKLLSDKKSGDVLGGTFHSFANYALRKYGKLIGIKQNFTIIDTGDTEDIIDLMKTELRLAKKGGRSFPKKGTVQSIISKAKNLETTIVEIIEKEYDHYIDFAQDIELVDKAVDRYKKAANLFDFDDLMLVLRSKLNEVPSFRQALQKSIKYILVDEYQDTNNAQREIVELMANNGQITVVGDDSQSIYGFRGANFENILRFPQTFPSSRVVKLETNYRSQQGVLNFTNDVIAEAKIGFKKTLHACTDRRIEPTIKQFADQTSEAEYIVDKMINIKQNDLNYSDFAVLTRAGWQSNFVQAELMKRGIPFVVVGGIKFAERRHIKDVMAFMKIVLNPLDAVAWHRILKLIEGVGKVRAAEIVRVIHQNKGEINLNSFSARKYYRDLNKLAELLQPFQEGPFQLNDLTDSVINFYKPALKRLEDDYKARYEDLDIFKMIVAKYKELEGFLAEFTLEPPSNRFQDDTQPLVDTDEKPMVVSTIHSAKGLEWHTVFLPHVMDGMIPSIRSLETIAELEEERRLFYVAASRAKENLFVTMPAFVSQYGGYFTKPSRFIADVQKGNYVIER
jgi:DNA helicase-2/ATP-dependent DNA helicase PcrA